jgi:hypothetical protein
MVRKCPAGGGPRYAFGRRAMIVSAFGAAASATVTKSLIILSARAVGDGLLLVLARLTKVLADLVEHFAQLDHLAVTVSESVVTVPLA